METAITIIITVLFVLIVPIVLIIPTVPIVKGIRWLYRKFTEIGKPTEQQTFNVTYDTVTLQWKEPRKGAKRIKLYNVLYHTNNDPQNEWRSILTTNETKVRVARLTPRTVYIFKIRPENGTQYGDESDPTHPITTKPKFPGKPNPKPESTRVTQNSISLKWGEPEYGADLVVRYNVLYRVRGGEWKTHIVEGNHRNTLIDKLDPETEYYFKVCPEGELGIDKESDESSAIKTDKILTKRIKEQPKTRRISKEGVFPAIYAFPIEPAGGRRYVIREPSSKLSYNPRSEKVLMLIGATGSGKTTLLNGIVNYLLRVRLEDNFRFKLEHKVDANQAHSQTDKVMAYTFYPMDGSRIPYVLTIIDTPGFGDTRGMKQDKQTLGKIHGFFSIGGQHGIDHFNGVGVVLQSSASRLTETQKYIFNSILSVFAKDVSSNMFLMVTFADGQIPPVLSAVKEAAIPFASLFKFNNSALFANPETDAFLRGFWELGVQSLDKFFEEFESIKPVSIENSRCVLTDRHQIEIIVEELTKKITEGLDKISELNSEKEALEAHKSEAEMNKNFEYVVSVSKNLRKKLQSGQKALNCNYCRTSCNYPCELESEEDLYNCIIMNTHDPLVACCTICPSQCGWEQHVLDSSRYENVKQKETRTMKSLKSRYVNAKNNVELSEKRINELENQISQTQKDVLINVEQAKECKKRLEELALKPSVLTVPEYIDILIQMEKSEKRDGYLQRIEALNELKEAAKILANLEEDCDQNAIMKNMFM